MRGMLSANVAETWRDYCLPSITGIVVPILENSARPPLVGTLTRHRQHTAQQLTGVEKLPGTYPLTHECSLNGLRLNRPLHRLIEPAWRRRFLRSPQLLYAEAGLSGEGQQLLNARDQQGSIQYGTSFFLLKKIGAVIGVSNLHIYVMMHRQTLEAFQQTRNQQVTYSVAGKR